jgi:hypothetical protein
MLSYSLVIITPKSYKELNMTKWKLVVDTKFTVDEDVDEVANYIYSLRCSGQSDIKWYPESTSITGTKGGFFTGYSCTGDSPRGATDLIPTHWKWKVNLSEFKDKDWTVRLFIEGLKAQGHKDVLFHPEESMFTGNATEEIGIPSDAEVS